MEEQSVMGFDPVRGGNFVFPVQKQRLPDGRWVLVPGEPEMRVRTPEAERITGIPRKTLHRLAESGVVRCAAVSPRVALWWPAEILEMIERMSRDPMYARRVRLSADGI